MGGVAFLFGGPGAAEAGMGKDLYNKVPLVREAMDKADKVMNEAGGVRPTKACFAAGPEILQRPSVAGPALLALAHGVFRALKARRLHPQAAAALGWGEQVAVAALGGWDFEAALRLLLERGRAVEAAWAADPWHALSVQGLPAGPLEARLAALPEPPRRAALLAPDHLVLTGREEVLKRLAAALAAGRGVRLSPVEPGWQWPHPALAPLGPGLAAAAAELPTEPVNLPVQGAAPLEAARGPRDWPARAGAPDAPLDWTVVAGRLRGLSVDTVVEVGAGAALGAALRATDTGLRALSTQDAASFAQAVKLAH